MASSPARPGAAARPTFVLVHGGMGAASQLQCFAEVLSPLGHCVGVNQLGHGGRKVPDELTLAAMGDDVVQRLWRAGIRRPYLLGHCMGSLTVLNVLGRYPDLAAGAVLVAPRYHYDAPVMEHWRYLMSDERLQRRSDVRSQHAANHGPNWMRLIEVQRVLVESLAEGDVVAPELLAGIRCPMLIFGAAQDPLSTADEALWLEAAIPGAKAVIWEGSAHPAEEIATPRFAAEVARFFGLRPSRSKHALRATNSL